MGIAFRFIDFILAADVGAQLSNSLAYATPNEASLKLITPAVALPDQGDGEADRKSSRRASASGMFLRPKPTRI